MAERIVVVEDESDILEVITYNLEREGFRVTGAEDGAAGLDAVTNARPDVVLLDLMLPVIDGLEVCRRLKSDPLNRDTPIIMVSAKGEESDVILGLGLGADDYICKPFSPKELVARVKAVLRRGPLREEGTGNRRIQRGQLVIDLDRHEALIEGMSIDLTATEMRLVHYLASHPGRVFTRDQLLSKAIAGDAIVTDRNVDVHVRSIRKKMGALNNYIETVRGVGYRFRDGG